MCSINKKEKFLDSSTDVEFNEHFFAVEDENTCRKYFDEQVIDSEKYWQRLGSRPDFSGKVVLELGCGHGALSIDAALAGAKRVIGLDLASNRIDFARRITTERFPQIADKIEFHCLDIDNIPLDGEVDIVISKDTFEHVLNIGQVLQSIRRILREKGLLITGFSPLYYSPYGDHGFHAIDKRFKFPWAHLILGDKYVVQAYNDYHPGIQCSSVFDLGLNKLKRQDFLTAFDKAEFKLIYENVNAVEGASKLMGLFRLLYRIGILADYTTTNMYAILQKS